MKHTLKSAVTTTGRRMAGARSLWRANGMREEQFGRPVIGIANSFTQLVPGHVHLHEIGQYVKQRIEALGCFAAEFNTIAVDDGIAMGHDGMLYSLPSREIIADSVEYMASAHKIDALVCISNCDKITPGMLMAAMRLNIPTVFVSGGPMEAGKFDGVAAITFAAAMGAGVAFSAVTLLLYQGALTIIFSLAGQGMDPAVISGMSAVGGTIIVGIGINMLGLPKEKIRVGNMLPAIFLPILYVPLADWIGRLNI